MKLLKAVQQTATSGPTDRTLIVLALITAATSVVTAFVMHRRSDRQNTQQHERSYSLLESVDHRVTRIDETVSELAADVGGLKSSAETNAERIARLEATQDMQRGDHR